jgi:hypothetical protein
VAEDFRAIVDHFVNLKEFVWKSKVENGERSYALLYAAEFLPKICPISFEEGTHLNHEEMLSRAC